MNQTAQEEDNEGDANNESNNNNNNQVQSWLGKGNATNKYQGTASEPDGGETMESARNARKADAKEGGRVA